jgi:hypothetical protein
LPRLDSHLRFQPRVSTLTFVPKRSHKRVRNIPVDSYTQTKRKAKPIPGKTTHLFVLVSPVCL